MTADEVTDCEGFVAEETEVRAPKKSRTSAASSDKARLAELQKLKQAAAKREDFAEALRLKQEIEALQAKAVEAAAVKAAAKASAKAAAAGGKGVKRPAPESASPEKVAGAAVPDQPRQPAVSELAADPYFDDRTPSLLAPECVTAREREAWRAVQTGNTDFLAQKLLGSLPLFCQRDVVSRQTALHLAITKADTKSISVLARKAVECSRGREAVCGGRLSSMRAAGTGTMDVQTLGFETGKIGAARGGRELNNALVDPDDRPEPIQAVIGRAPLSEEQVKLLMGLQIVNQDAVCRRGKIHWLGQDPRNSFKCNMGELLEPALRHGRLPIARALIEQLAAFGAGPAHQAAVRDEPLPERLQGRSVTAKLRFGNITPVHLAAINPDASKLSELLKLEPTALSLSSESGLQAVHCAAACEGPGPLKVLLSEWNADRRSTGPGKRTPLHFAAAAGRAESVRVLMGGAGIGVGGSTLFAKEIRAILLRQRPSTMKIGTDGICILSRLLIDLLHRITAGAKAIVEEAQKLGMKALHQATREVLKGALAARIVEQSGKLAAGKLGLPKPVSSLAKALSEICDDVFHVMFNKVDKDGNGKLDRKEVKAVFESAGIKISNKTFAKVLKTMDSDGNGDVSLEEFRSWMEAGSTYAVSLRHHLVVGTGEMGAAEVAEAEVATEEDLLQGVDKLAFDARPLLELLKCPGMEDSRTLASTGEYMSAILECTCTKVLQVSANAARSRKKTSISPEHLLSSIKANEDLQGMYQTDSVVMNSLLLQAKDKEAYTALHVAAEAGHLHVVETLLACGAEADAPGPERKAPLALAAERGHLGCVKALLRAGAKLESADKRKRTALLLAVRSGHTVVASALLHAGADPDAADDSGNTIVHYAAAFGWEHCIDLLHKAGAALSCANAMKLAPITAALQKGHKTVFRRMLDLGIDVNFRDADGSTLLLRCLSTVNRLVYEEVGFMMSKGGDPTLSSSVDGTTALHSVARASVGGSGNGSSAYAPHPLEAERLARVTGWLPRPKPTEQEPAVDEDPDARGAPGRPAKKARTNGKEEEKLDEKVYRRGFHQLTVREREAVFLLGWQRQQWQNGDNPTVPWSALDEKKREAAQTLGLDEASWPAMPVHAVTGIRQRDGRLPFAEGMAVSAGEDGTVCVKMKTGHTANMHVSQLVLLEEDLEEVWRKTPHVTVGIASMLVERRALVDARDSKGATPLMLALRTGNVDLAMILLDAGADPNAQENPPPLSLADQQKRPQPKPRTPLLDVSEAPREGLKRGTYAVREVVKKLLAKGCRVDDAPTAVDPSPVLKFIDSGDFESAALLLDAKADPGMDSSGENALHKLFKHAFKSDLSAEKKCGEPSSPVPLVQRLLKSADWGAKLMSAYTRSAPHITPLHSLVDAFASNSVKRSGITCTSKQQLLELLELTPAAVDFSKWIQPPAEPEKSNAQPPSSPLSLLCGAEFFEDCHELGVAVVSLLCKRGVSPNAVAGSPAALHSLMQRLEGRLYQSSLAKVLLPLTDLRAHLPDGHTLLTCAIERCVSSRSVDAHTRATVRMLLESRCDPNQPDDPPVVVGKAQRRPRPPLHLAAQLRDEGLALDLLAARADPAAVDNPQSRRAPLHFAIAAAPTGSDASFDMEEVLLRARADVSAQDALGWSVLHYAFVKEANGALDFKGKWLELAQKQSAEEPAGHQWEPSAWQAVSQRVDPIETISSLCVIQGAPVNAKDRDGMSPLHLAALRGSSIAALKLINAKANLEDEFQGNTALGLAMHSYPDMAVLLMQRSASTTSQCTLFKNPGDGVPCSGKPESIFSLAVRKVSRLGSNEKASTYLGAAIAAMDCGFPRSQALDDTISSQQFIMLLTLIPKVGDDILRTQRFKGGQNVLHRLAAVTNHARSARTPPSAPTAGGVSLVPRTFGGFGGAAFAAGGRGPVASGAPEPAPSPEAMQGAYFKAAKKLLERGVAVDSDDSGRTPLHLAALMKHRMLVSLMLSQSSVGPETVRELDVKGVSALGCALFGGGADEASLGIAKELLAHGASARNALVDEKRGLHALSFCIVTQRPPVQWQKECWPQVLFSREAPDVTPVDRKRRSCLMHAALSGQFSVSYLRLVMRWARAAGAAAGQQLLLGADEDGLTALMHAVDGGKVNFVDQLLREAHEVSADVLRQVLTAQAPDGSSPLMRAVGCPDAMGMVCALLRWTSDAAAAAVLGAVDGEGRSALSRAVLRNSAPTVAALLRGRPLRPLPTKAACPAGRMAGHRVVAQAVYQGSAQGAPQFGISWLPQRTDLPVEAVILEADGWSSVDLCKELKGPLKGEIHSGAKVRVLAACGEQLEVDTLGPLGRGFIEARHARQQNGSMGLMMNGQDAALASLTLYGEVVMPAGSGPGVPIEVAWDGATGGPGSPGLASGFADEADLASRAPPALLGSTDARGWTTLHHCVCPLAFGSFENTEILAALVKAGVPADARSSAGQTAADMASKQRSGRMMQRLKELGVATPATVCAMEVDQEGEWPKQVDVEADAATALEAAEAKRQKVEGKPEPPVDRHFQKPSPSSRVAVARGADGQPLDLVMTKVDLSRPFCPQNVFYRMQVVHELNQDNYFLFTRWGRIGPAGQFQRTPFESLERASAEFCKIFKSKAGNDWADRAKFVQKPLKYQLHELKYASPSSAADALQVAQWRRLPAEATPPEFRRVVNVGSCHQLLVSALRKANIDQPLGLLKKKPLEEAKGMLQEIRVLVRQMDEERRKPEPSGERFQTLLDRIAGASSRIYELVPTTNFQHATVGPIDDVGKVRQWLARLDETDDLTCAARLLLGAQARVQSASPTDYLYSALGVRALPLKSDSEELRLIEQYVNRSAPRECLLFSGPGALPLPERAQSRPLRDTLPRWQVLQDVVCYHSPECSRESHAGQAAVAGCLLREYAQEAGSICIQRAQGQAPGLWVKPVDAGAELMVKLTEREAESKIAAVYRLDRRGEEARAGGETATLLYHGSGMANALSILSQGLRVKPPGAMHHGSAFGNGIYFANSYCKSRGYSSLHNGVGFMLLSEVSPGRTYKAKAFNFLSELTKAHLEAARNRLGLPADASLDHHPELKEAANRIQADIKSGEIEDFTGTDYDSFHFQSGAAPDKSGDVVHPDGYSVPCGEIAPQGGSPRDEIIVYETSRVRLRYLLELRDPNAFDVFTPVKKPSDTDETMGVDEIGGDGGNRPAVRDPDDDDDDASDEESSGQEDEDEED